MFKYISILPFMLILTLLNWMVFWKQRPFDRVKRLLSSQKIDNETKYREKVSTLYRLVWVDFKSLFMSPFYFCLKYQYSEQKMIVLTFGWDVDNVGGNAQYLFVLNPFTNSGNA